MRLEYIVVDNATGQKRHLIDDIYAALDGGIDRINITEDVFVAKATAMGATKAEAEEYFKRNAFRPCDLRG